MECGREGVYIYQKKSKLFLERYTHAQQKIMASKHRSVISNGQSLYQHPSDLPVQAEVLANKPTNLPGVW